MTNFLIIFFLTLGALCILISAIGLLKMPDVFLRMSASTIAGTLGVASILIGAALYYSSLGISLRVAAVIVFLVLTVPIGTHIMARACYIHKLPRWKKTLQDDLEDKYVEDAKEPYFKPKSEKDSNNCN